MKKILSSLVLGFLLIGMVYFSIGIVSAVDPSYCCEKTTDGAWCQNAPEAQCAATPFRKASTSCESTSYCKLGCCYDSQEGTCYENTPERVCEGSNGIWEENAECDIPACTLGCCLIGDQASFVTQTRCKKLASVYGLEINFRTDVGDELTCIASATSDVKGACVFEKEYSTTCLFTTKKECATMAGNNSAEFHEGYLCSADELGTVCGPTEKTTCVDGSDEVFFMDSCGNVANIYDSSKLKDKTYWTKLYGKAESCSYGDSNANSVSCGNCDYYLGSICKSAKVSQRPTYGNNICADLSCSFEGQTYQHGETWCANSKGIDKNLPGSKSFRMVCYNGEVSVEPCAEYRQERCIQSEVNNFKSAACRVNKWQDCSAQTEKDDCENGDKRDCNWLTSTPNRCVPLYAPGFDLGTNSSESNSICSLATTTCTIKYEKKLVGEKKCVENCECAGGGAAWKSNMQSVCNSLGDCGVKTNYLGVTGFNKWS